MTPARPATILRLDPSHQPLWRDGTRLQFGLDRRAEIEVTEPWQDALLARLARGIPSETFDVVAHSCGAPRRAAHEMLATIRPALRTPRATPPRVHVSSEQLPATALLWTRETLHAEGLLLTDAADRGSVALVTVRGAAATRAFATLLAEDRAHLPVAFDEGGASIGPLVVPGRTPCLHCRDAAAAEQDPAWPLIHAQMIERDPGEISAARVVEATTIAARMLSDARTGGLWLRISRDGERSRHPLRFHAECQCRSLRSQPESARVTALHARSSATTTPTATAQPV